MKKRTESKREVAKIVADSVNEVAVIAAVYTDESARKRYLRALPAESFFAAGHEEMWRALQEIDRRGLTPDAATVQSIAGERVDVRVLEEYARTSQPSSAANLKQHVESVRWDRARIECAKGPLASFVEAIRDPTAEPDRVRALAKQVAVPFEGLGDLRYLRDSGAVVREHAVELTRRRTGHATFTYGLDGLDFYGPHDFAERKDEHGKTYRKCLEGEPRMIPGASPGKVTVVVGVSRSGKTTSTARKVLHWVRSGRKVLWGAWEQMPGPSLELLATMDLGWSRTDMMVGEFDAEEQDILLERMEELGAMIRFFELPFGRVRSEERWERGRMNDRHLDLIEGHIAGSGCDVAVLDLFRRSLVETQPDQEESALYRIQAIGQETRAHLVLVQQLRLKDVETREDKRPTLEAVKGNSAWVDIADAMLGIYRPFLYRSVPDDKAEILILKQRFGVAPQCVEFDWDPEFATFENGRTIDVARPGELSEMDSFLGGDVQPPRSNGKRRSFAGRG